MKKDSIAVIGRLAEGTELLDGQTVKTKILYEELQKAFPDRHVVCVDVYQYRRHFFGILFRTLKAFLECGHIFVLLSRNGRKFFFPVLTGLNRIFQRRLYHDVVGGALPKEAEERPALVRQLKRFDVNWVELPEMKEQLAKLGVHNVEVLRNFKQLSILSGDMLPEQPYGEPFSFVMFSRVVKEKGMETAACAVSEVNRRAGRRRAVLNIYGPVEPGYEETFGNLLEEYSSCVSYCGCVPYGESVQALAGNYMLLFPSVYPGEGLPGTLIDAYSAGLPVIVSDWRFNRQLVRKGETGFCYEWKKPEQLTEYISYAMDHPEEIQRMRPLCIEEARKYTPEAVMGQIIRKVEDNEKGKRGRLK